MVPNPINVTEGFKYELILENVSLGTFEIGDGVDGRPNNGIIYAPDTKNGGMVEVDTKAKKATTVVGKGAWCTRCVGTIMDRNGTLYTFNNIPNGGAELLKLTTAGNATAADKYTLEQVYKTENPSATVNHGEYDASTNSIIFTAAYPAGVFSLNLDTFLLKELKPRVTLDAVTGLAGGTGQDSYNYVYTTGMAGVHRYKISDLGSKDEKAEMVVQPSTDDHRYAIGVVKTAKHSNKGDILFSLGYPTQDTIDVFALGGTGSPNKAFANFTNLIGPGCYDAVYHQTEDGLLVTKQDASNPQGGSLHFIGFSDLTQFNPGMVDSAGLLSLS